jgi:hypothetical protein
LCRILRARSRARARIPFIFDIDIDIDIDIGRAGVDDDDFVGQGTEALETAAEVLGLIAGDQAGADQGCFGLEEDALVV